MESNNLHTVFEVSFPIISWL